MRNEMGLKRGDKAFCAGRLGVVRLAFANGRVLVDVGKPNASRDSDRNARVYEPEQVKQA